MSYGYLTTASWPQLLSKTTCTPTFTTMEPISVFSMATRSDSRTPNIGTSTLTKAGSITQIWFGTRRSRFHGPRLCRIATCGEHLAAASLELRWFIKEIPNCQWGHKPPSLQKLAIRFSLLGRFPRKEFSLFEPLNLLKPRIPKGFRLKAQGCEERATLGLRRRTSTTLKGLRQIAPPKVYGELQRSGTCTATMNRRGLLPLLHWRRGPGRGVRCFIVATRFIESLVSLRACTGTMNRHLFENRSNVLPLLGERVGVRGTAVPASQVLPPTKDPPSTGREGQGPIGIWDLELGIWSFFRVVTWAQSRYVPFNGFGIHQDERRRKRFCAD